MASWQMRGILVNHSQTIDQTIHPNGHPTMIDMMLRTQESEQTINHQQNEPMIEIVI